MVIIKVSGYENSAPALERFELVVLRSDPIARL
jgi:hypothetical protein